jgi:uncharacterized protein (DUF1015 family)
MADFRPFAALRYDTAMAGDASNLIAPPYDVVSAEQARALYARSPYNISRVDYGPERPDDTETENRYTRARRELDGWRQRGVLKPDGEPRFYVYDQEFKLEGAILRRRSLFGALRLEEWEKGIIIPHEHTRPRDKADRYSLLEATRVQLSPIMALYQDPGVATALTDSAIEAPVLEAVLDGDRHTLRPVAAPAASDIQTSLANQRLYIADGHHRYEVSLACRNERRAAATHWTGDEPENFVLAALIDVADPGLVVLPTHRLLRLPDPDLTGIGDAFDIKGMTGGHEGLHALTEALAAAGREGSAFGLISDRGAGLRLLTLRDRARVDASLPADRLPDWRALDVAVLHYAVLPAIGFAESPDTIAFIETAEEAFEAVAHGVWDAAVLLNPTRVEQIIATGNAGERMPQKSTFFYPKLATGVVMRSFD